MQVYAFVPDLLDRARIQSALAPVEFVSDPAQCADAELVVVDLTRDEELVAAIRAVAPSARIVGFAPHVDDARLRRAREAGADVALPRSRFFRDVTSAVAAK